MTTRTDTPSSPRSGTLTRRLERAGLAFETGILEALHERDPDDLVVLAALAEACTRLRRYQRGLQLDRRLVEQQPDDPVFRYNLACSLVLTGELGEAATTLVAAVERGYRDFEHLEADADLRRLREDAGFPELLDRLRALARQRDDEPEFA